ncbi:MAG: DUF3168 domain-containing protein [Alphaproteobacteria bacterium]|nr:MAG: DUF3168 domain-containing protein [Alphaproteobacteria bacterium]
MNDPHTAVQDALMAVLMASAALKARIGDPPRLYDHVPAGPVFPFLSLGGARSRRMDDLGGDGMAQEITLHAWSRYRGQREIKDMLAAMYGALHNAPLTVAGQSFALALFVDAATDLEEDGLTYHAQARYRLLTSS